LKSFSLQLKVFGIEYIDTLLNFKIAQNPELRYYGNGFIPNNGVSSKFLGPLEKPPLDSPGISTTCLK